MSNSVRSKLPNLFGLLRFLSDLADWSVYGLEIIIRTLTVIVFSLNSYADLSVSDPYFRSSFDELPVVVFV